MSCIHGLQHVDNLRASHFSDYYPVRSHPESRLYEVSYRDFGAFFGIFVPDLEAHQIFDIVDLKFR